MLNSNHLEKLFPYTPAKKRDRFLPALNKHLPRYGINTARRVRAFLATFGIETDYAKTTVEYASGAAYEGRKDLGNIFKGDGVKYKGRGGFQTTGRYNYERVNQRCGRKLGIDFIKNPERLAEIDVAIESACIFWEENNLSSFADDAKFFAVSGVVNRGNPNKKALHYDKRLELYRLCEKVIPASFSFSSNAPNTASNQTGTVKPEVKCPNPNCNYFAVPPICTKCGTIFPDNSATTITTEAEKPSSSVKDFTSKYLKHTPADSVKNIFVVVVARITAAATALWNFGFSGRALLFLIVFAAIVPIVIAVVYYRPRLVDWGKQIWDGFFGD